jgi:hypothetical protein
MVLRRVYMPVRPEMDRFLFARVGEEVDGIPLSVLSALVRLGLDPRDEAARLSRLTSEAAADQLARMIARLPDRPWTSSEIRRIANTLIELLPVAKIGGDSDQVTTDRVGSDTNGKLSSGASPLLIYLALALLGVVLFSLIAHGHVASDGQASVQPVSQADPMSGQAR